MTSPGQANSDVSRRWLPLLLIGLGFAAYANTASVPFVYDDYEAIVTNRSIERLSDLRTVLHPPAEGGLTVSGRPLLNLTLAVNFALSGRDPWSYHLVNTLVHGLAGLVLFGLVRRTLRREQARPYAQQGGLKHRPPLEPSSGGGRCFSPPSSFLAPDVIAFFTAALWLVHPLCTQAVTYTVQRAESLMALFYLLTVYGFVRATEGSSRGWLALSVLAGLAGAATKEVIVTVPLLTFLYARTFVSGSFRSAWREWRFYWVALASVWIALGLLIASTGGDRGGTIGFGTGVPWWAYGLTQVQAVARYLGLSVWPQPLVFEYGTFWVARAHEILPFLPVVLTAAAATVWALCRAPRMGFLGAWFFGILAPTSLAPGTIQMIVEHRMYLPLAGIVTLVVVAVGRFAGTRAVPLGAAAIVALGLTTWVRNSDYRTALSLWTDTVEKRPLNGRAHDSLADALAKAGRHAEALEHWAMAVRLMPVEGRYRYNHAGALSRAGRRDDAVREYQRAAQLLPGDASIHNNLAVALAAAGRTAEALEHARRAADSKPGDAGIRYNLALAELRNGRRDAARGEFARVLDLDPRHAGARLNLGNLLLEAGEREEAKRHYRAGLDAAPTDNELETMLGAAELLAGRPDDAERHFAAVIERTVGSRAQNQSSAEAGAQHREALHGLGEVRTAQERWTEARTYFEAVLAGDPNHARANYKLGNVWMQLGEPGRAIPHYEAALKADPRDAVATHHLGLAHARLGEWHEAREAIRRALQLRPDQPEARRHLEQVERMLGDRGWRREAGGGR